MLFNSLEFAIFLPLVFIVYWSLQRFSLVVRNLFLAAMSCVFYGWWDYRFLSLIALSAVVDFVVAPFLHKESDKRRRLVLLSVSVGTNLGVLAAFKYFNFFKDSFAELMLLVGFRPSMPTLDILLPVGISFYTFQTLSYTIDVYRGRMTPTRDFVAFFAFVSFFPQLVAGPIERAQNLLPQFLERRKFVLSDSRDGLRRMLLGFLKKVVVADNLAPHVDEIFGNYSTCDSSTLLVGVFLFAMQIYCDFSGYSDIAIGTARLFGFELTQNFAYPYFSRNFGEFWSRWHISLSSWFRDYLYIPLGGNRATRLRRAINIIVTFSVSGLWHGANWTYVVWGLLNGLYYVPYVFMGQRDKTTGVVAEGRLFPGVRDVVNISITFSATLLAWVFFRSPTLTDAFAYLARFVTTPWGGIAGDLIWPLAVCILVLMIEWLQRSKVHALAIEGFPVVLRWTIYVFGIAAFIVFGNFGRHEFIYFQF
jgi:alginate O-acetyltransferase complex protein AlgI